MRKEDVIRLTQEYGGDWGVTHSERLINMISIISEGIDYNKDVIWLAAYLHDWGGYQKWAVQGVDHCIRSKQVAGDFLRQNRFSSELTRHVLECVEFHHGGGADRSIESILITDADALDLLGVVGTLRLFSLVSKNLRGAVETVKTYRDMSVAAITLETTRKIAKKRIKETDRLLQALEEETFGIY